MCRLAAYLGPEIPLENIIIAPKHSLLEQSQSANEAKLAVNGDGFGLSWYGRQQNPGLYKDVLPAWSDGNLSSICRMIHSSIFLAHVRASTVGETSRVNCHPFAFNNWSFMHNGQIAQFDTIRRRLESSLSDKYYHFRRGTTDSELLFLLLLSNGLIENPKAAIETVIAMITCARKQCWKPSRLTCVISDGESLYAFRYSCDGKSPTLYISGNLDSGGRAICSEPLDGERSNWSAIPESHFVTLSSPGSFAEPLNVPLSTQI